jgi:acyl dehydratase
MTSAAVPVRSQALSELSGAGVEDVIGVRRIGDVMFEQAVRLGDRVTVEVEVERTRDLSAEAVVAATSWRIVNEFGETLVTLRADMVCRRSAAARTQFDEADRDCVDNIPV